MNKTNIVVDTKKPKLLNEHLRPLHFLPWHLFKKKKNCSYKLNGVMTYGMYEAPDDTKIIAYCGWTQSNKRLREEFIWSSYGYENAIKWIEKQRISFIEDLL